MDFNTALAYITDESRKKELLVYVAIGCALGRYPEGEHPKQQYPPYLSEFKSAQICVYIDPMLEMPPRATKDIENNGGDITILTIQHMFDYGCETRFNDSAFLRSLCLLCMDQTKSVKMIVHDFTGHDINKIYPASYGIPLFKNVIYDPMYGDGDCLPDISTIKIIRDQNGDFIQPAYSRLQELYTYDKKIFKRQFDLRKYPIVHLLLRIYRIRNGLEEQRDWCTEEMIMSDITRYRIVYNIQQIDNVTCLKHILMMVLQDLCIVGETYLTDEEMHTIIHSTGREFENFWNMITVLIQL
jgi:hypothetical protein